MRHPSPSSDSSISPPSSPTPTRSHTRTRPPRTIEEEPAVIGGIGKLLRLALFAALLALVVPYIRGFLFGNPNGLIKDGANVTKGINVSMSAAKGAVKGAKEVIQEVVADVEEGLDVFNFKHDDYLPSAVAKRGKDKVKDLADSSPSAVIQKPASQRQQLKKAAGSKPQPQPQPLSRTRQRNNDEEDFYLYPAPDTHSNTSSVVSIILSILTTIYTLTIHLVQFGSIPFRLLFSLTLSLLTTIYSYSRLVLSHTLRPVVTLLAPLTYLLSGILYVFVQTPANLVGAVVREFYPVYTFLGAAAVVGIGMGLTAAAVLYITAFVFVDRVPTQQAKLVKTKGKNRMLPEQEGEQDVFGRPPSETDQKYPSSPHHSYHSQYSNRPTAPAAPGYFATNPSNYTSSPLVSPTTPYRTARGGESRKASYSSDSAPTSSLRASVA